MDFNLDENCIVCHEDKFNPEDFEIVEVYRFEGNQTRLMRRWYMRSKVTKDIRECW